MECGLSWPGRHGGENVGPLVMLCSQEAEREMNAQLDFAFFIQPGTPVRGMTPPAFSASPPGNSPGNLLQTHSEMYLLDGPRFNQLDNEDYYHRPTLVNLTRKHITFSHNIPFLVLKGSWATHHSKCTYKVHSEESSISLNNSDIVQKPHVQRLF